MTHTDPTPPTNHDAERGSLGSLLIAPTECVPLLGRILRAEDFHEPRHRTIFTTACALWNADAALDILLLTAALRQAGKLESVGGPAYIAELYAHTPTPANAEHYAGLVRESSQLRALWTACREVAAAATSPDADVATLSGHLCATLASLACSRPREPMTMCELATDALERYEAATLSAGKRPVGVTPTGIDALDNEIEGGLHPGDLIILAAETSGGKTALAIQIAAKVALRYKSQVLVASYEMTARQLFDRMAALGSGVPSCVLRGGRILEDGFRRLAPALESLAVAGIHLRDAIGHWTVDDVATESRAVKARSGLHLLIVDYLQLAAPRTAPRGAQRNREREVAEISRALKGLAVELNITVIALSQLNEDGRLRESRAIGQDADVVLIIAPDPDKDEDRRLIKIDKNRHGARDKCVPVAWNGPLMQFT